MENKGFYPIQCPCCGEGLISEKNGICPVCNWEDDRVQNTDVYFEGGANRDSLMEHRRKFLEKRYVDEMDSWEKGM